MPVYSEGKLDTSKTRTFLGGFDDDVFYFAVVTDAG
jgi:hypothetical protein